MSRPTEIMLLARATSIWFSDGCRVSSAFFAAAIAAVVSRLVSSTGSYLMVRFFEPRVVAGLTDRHAQALILRRFHANFILEEAPHPAELAEAVEVADEGHVRVRDIARHGGVFEEALRGTEQRDVRPNEDSLHRTPRGRHADVEAPGVSLVDVSEERLGVIDSGGRKHVHPAAPEHRSNLLLGPAYRRRRR